MERDEIAAYLALARLPGIGSLRLRTLLAAFRSARAALTAPHGAIAALPGFSRSGASAVRACSLATGREIVGSRNHSPYGAEAARLLAGGAARAGVVVVSGMARGIDAIAHAAALDAGAASVGVLGNGFGVIYPAANRALYERMVARGCLITELPPGDKPHAGAFPRRNRLISGLARVTVVVEAAPGS